MKRGSGTASVLVLVSVALANVSACGNQEPTPDLLAVQDLAVADDLAPQPLARSFPQIVQYIIRPNCSGFTGCHSANGSRGGLDLRTDPYRALVGAPAANLQAASEGRLRVKPCDPDASFLWVKLILRETPALRGRGYGAAMPFEADTLPPEELEAIRRWIARGALPDEPPDVDGDRCTFDGGTRD